jgi:hypothetical protein
MGTESDGVRGRALGRGERVAHAVVAAVLAAVFVASFAGVDRVKLYPPLGAGDGGTSICLLKRLTGIPCMTCGMTRSFCAIGRGRLAEAARFHPLGPVVYAMLAAVMIRAAVMAAFGRMWLGRTVRVLIWSIPVLVAAAIVIWAVRLAVLFSSGAGAEAWRASPIGRFISMLT